MSKELTHPDLELFDYLNGTANAAVGPEIESHLSVCADCKSIAALVKAMKATAIQPEGQRLNPDVEFQRPDEHPDVGELASFFYAKSRRTEESAVAAHVALCGSCSEAIAQYARADRAANDYKLNESAQGAVPAAAWEMIHDWEGSSFAKLRPAGEVLGPDLLARLSGLLTKQRPAVRESGTQEAERVPVMVVSGSGEVRSIEFFEKSVDSTGASILRHAERSERFDKKTVHVLLQQGDRDPVIVSDLVHNSTIRLQMGERQDNRGVQEHYFIVDE